MEVLFPKKVTTCALRRVNSSATNMIKADRLSSRMICFVAETRFFIMIVLRPKLIHVLDPRIGQYLGFWVLNQGGESTVLNESLSIMSWKLPRWRADSDYPS